MTNPIVFKSRVEKLQDFYIMRLPKNTSSKLKSRGPVMSEIHFDDEVLSIILEPDGRGSHFIIIPEKLGKNLLASQVIEGRIYPSTNWVEPDVPIDLNRALKGSLKAASLWNEITPAARWDWIRWIRSTKFKETRQKRIEVAISKLESGSRRPCCFNRNICSIAEISKGGQLVDSKMAAV
jgi:hypothetical protein